MKTPVTTSGAAQGNSAIPNHGVHEAGRFRSVQTGQHMPVEKGEAHNFGPERVSFGYDPSKPHANRMKAKETSGRHAMFGVMQANESAAIRVQQWRCAMVRNRNANCMKCAAACTSGCISVVDDRLHIDASKCVGCGTCATVCPTCALESSNPTDAELFETTLRLAQEPADTSAETAVRSEADTPAASFASAGPSVDELLELREKQPVTIACHLLVEALAGLVDAQQLAEVVCLGRVDESLLVGLAAQGVPEIVLACGVCENCEQAVGLDCARAVVDTTCELLGLWGSTCKVGIQQGVPAYVLKSGASGEGAQTQLQQFFSTPRANVPLRQVNKLQDTLASSEEHMQQPESASSSVSEVEQSEEIFEVLKVMADGTLPHFIPARRERLLDALFELGQPAEKTVSTRLWGCIAINPEKCISCRMCATFCPTGAIAKYGEQDSENFGVEHYPGDCVNCTTCQAICPQDAITITTEIQSAYLLGGEVHTYPMLPRAVALNNSHQIVNTMRSYIDGDIFER